MKILLLLLLLISSSIEQGYNAQQNQYNQNQQYGNNFPNNQLGQNQYDNGYGQDNQIQQNGLNGQNQQQQIQPQYNNQNQNINGNYPQIGQNMNNQNENNNNPNQMQSENNQQVLTGNTPQNNQYNQNQPNEQQNMQNNNEQINQNQKRTRKYQPIESNVMFNDAYVETNPKINNKMKARYQFEKKIKENNNHLYSDELHICPEKLNSLNRKIKDNYECNPIPVLNEQDIKKMSDDNYKKNQKRCENIKGYTNSNALKGLFNYNNEQFESDKIINHKPIVNNINKDNVSYGKKSFKFCAARNGGYSYM